MSKCYTQMSEIFLRVATIYTFFIYGGYRLTRGGFIASSFFHYAWDVYDSISKLFFIIFLTLATIFFTACMLRFAWIFLVCSVHNFGSVVDCHFHTVCWLSVVASRWRCFSTSLSVCVDFFQTSFFFRYTTWSAWP